MKILGYIHTFNDEDVIDRPLEALLDQTYPLEEILVVDNGSTDGTLDRAFPEHVTVIRHPENRGTSGAVITGFQYALKNRYDWIWIFDGDSAPRRDALEELVALYQSFPAEVQAQTSMLASLPMDTMSQTPNHGVVLNSMLGCPVAPRQGQKYYECDVAMWTGCLFKLEAVRRVGLPRADYVLDMGELEYGYRAKLLGYRNFMHLSAITDHNVSGQSSAYFRRYHIGPVPFAMLEMPPIRCYYFVRNTIYFWFYEYCEGNASTIFRTSYILSKFVLNFFVRPVSHQKEIKACLRGLWDGLCKNMHHRF